MQGHVERGWPSGFEALKMPDYPLLCGRCRQQVMREFQDGTVKCPKCGCETNQGAQRYVRFDVVQSFAEESRRVYSQWFSDRLSVTLLVLGLSAVYVGYVVHSVVAAAR